jgi:hypothetical protein
VPGRVTRGVTDSGEVVKLGYALLDSVCAMTAQEDEASSSALHMDHWGDGGSPLFVWCILEPKRDKQGAFKKRILRLCVVAR